MGGSATKASRVPVPATLGPGAEWRAGLRSAAGTIRWAAPATPDPAPDAWAASTMTDIHAFLKAATATLHRDAEAAFAPFDLGAMPGYRGFLLAQAGALLPLERAAERGGVAALLPDWDRRRRAPLLRHDLGVLELRFDEGAAPPVPALDPLGLAYVLEGSRHGARVLRRRALAGRDADVAGAARFLNHPFDGRQWTDFLGVLQRHGDGPRRAGILTAAAFGFDLFRASALAVDEHTRRCDDERRAS